MKLRRFNLAFLCLTLFLLTCDADVEVKVFKTRAKKKGQVLFKARCVYKVSEKIPTATFTISLDTDITKFKSRQANVLSGSTSGSEFYCENAKSIKPAKFTVTFQGLYVGDAAVPPTGTCSDLVLPTSTSTTGSTSTTTAITTTTTSSPVTSTSNPPQTFAYSIPATITTAWNLTGTSLTRFGARCEFAVDQSMDPSTKYFNISMGVYVTDFEQYTGTTLPPTDGTEGRWFYVTNKYYIHSPKMEYSFHATHETTETPNVVCHSELPPYTTTTVANTTPQSTTSTAVKTSSTTTSATPSTTSTTVETSSKQPTTTTATASPNTSEGTTATTTTATMGPIPDLPYTVVADVFEEWSLQNCTRFKAECLFAVDSTLAPETAYFNVSMGTDVWDFEHFLGKKLAPTAGDAGNLFLVTNKFEVRAPMFSYEFHATHHEDSPPSVTCYSTLPVYEGTTTTRGTTTTQSSTTTTTEATTTDSTSGSSTTQKPVTTTSQSTTTGGQLGVQVQVANYWPNGDGVRFNGKCVFTISQTVESNEFKVKVIFSSATSDYQDWSWNKVDEDANGQWYERSNKHPLGSGTVTYDFQVSAPGVVPPTGRCYAMGVNPTATPTGSTATGSTATPGSTTEMTTIPFNSEYNYADAIHKSMLFYYAQRSGDLPADNPISWRGDSALGDKGDNNEDLTGGWYDAGDMVKFNFPMSASTTLLALGMYRWPQAYESIGLTDKMLDTLKWPLDYFLKCWNNDPINPKYYAQVGDGVADHSYWGRPEDMTMARPAYYIDKSNPGSDVAAETAAAMAVGSKLFRDSDPTYADKLLTAAEQLYDFADTYRAKYSDSIPGAAAYYRSWSGYTDELMLAATILYNVTENAAYLTKARQAHDDGAYDTSFEKAWGFSWDDKRILAQLFMYEITGEQKYRDLVDAFLDRYRGENVPEKLTQTPQGLAWRDNWGVLRYAANAVVVALMSAESGIDTTANRDWAARQINYMLGDNNDGFSYVIGFGNDYPKRPHHRAASCPSPPAKCDWSNYQYNGPNPHDIIGALVGGPDQSDQYVDERNNFQTNEVACDYNAGFQSALAGLVQLVNGNSGTVIPTGGTTVTAQTSSGTQPPATTTQPGTTTTLPDGVFNYEEVLGKSILFYWGQRSGDVQTAANASLVWKKPSALYDGDDVGLDLTGGWYDAGDYVKFNLPISSAVTILSWGVVQWKDTYVAAGQYRQMLDCIKWPLDFFLKCWREDSNEFYAQVGNGDIDHAWMGRPEDMTAATVSRPAYKVTASAGGSDVAGNVAAAFAAGAIAFKDEDPAYSATLLNAAKSLYTFADSYRGKYTDVVSDAGKFYSSSGYNDELVYAAAMLYKATGENKYLADAEAKYNEFGFDYQTTWAFDWDNKLMGAKLLLYDITGDSKYSRDVTSFLQQWRPQGSVSYTNGGLAWRSEWGTLRYTGNTAFLALMAADLGIEPGTNAAWAQGQINYILGDNPRGSSYVVGHGNNPPRRPHHKATICRPKPAACTWNEYNADTDNAHVLVGALVGGPDKNDNYVDDRTNYVMSEVTCDYNAGFHSAIAGLVHFQSK